MLTTTTKVEVDETIETEIACAIVIITEAMEME